VKPAFSILDGLSVGLDLGTLGAEIFRVTGAPHFGQNSSSASLALRISSKPFAQ
jgi:hypothetical protein